VAETLKRLKRIIIRYRFQVAFITRIIVVASGKGGVGKTTLVSNLAAALSGFNKNVIALDANVTTSNLGLHLGIPLYPVTLQDVLRGRANIKDALYYHPAGFRVVPADVSIKKLLIPRTEGLVDVFYKLTGDADFLLIDSAAGLGKEAKAAIEAADEMITVTNPELPALTDALKLGKFAENYETRNLGVVLNRIRNERHEIKASDVQDFLNLPLLGKVHEDISVRRAIAHKTPVVIHSPRSRSAQQFRQIAANLIGEEYKPNSLLFERLFGWLK
jgi:septum site-determining protein MinD